MREYFVSEPSITVCNVKELFITIEKCFEHTMRIVWKIRKILRMSLEHCKYKFNVFISIKTLNFKVIYVYSKPNKFLFIIRSQYWVFTTFVWVSVNNNWKLLRLWIDIYVLLTVLMGMKTGNFDGNENR
jgi:hypothetical protein